MWLKCINSSVRASARTHLNYRVTAAAWNASRATLMVALSENDRQKVLNSLKESCRQRIEYIAVPLESAPLPLPAPTPITIGGANIFCLEVDYYEEF